ELDVKRVGSMWHHEIELAADARRAGSSVDAVVGRVVIRGDRHADRATSLTQPHLEAAILTRVSALRAMC
ncbi:MAG: hypothetical protein AB1762_11615, partial [Gemmatimonadota bacterium]